MVRLFLLIALLVPCLAGCRQPSASTAGRQPLFDFTRLGQNTVFNRNDQSASNSFFGGDGLRRPVQIQTNTPAEFEEYSQLAQQIQSLNQRLGTFDADNQQLHTEIAGLKQKLQVAADYNNQIKQQLADTSTQFQQLQNEKLNVDRRLADTIQQGQLASTTGGVPAQLPGAATVRANNSLLQKLSAVQIPGGDARIDGDVIRVEFPSDILFVPGTYTIRADQNATIRNIVSTIRQYFPQQIVGIEAHWDGTALNPPTTTHHQLTATQALAVFNQLVQFGVPADQLFTMAMGSNRPRHTQATQAGVSPNRRIEIVIYPETYNGN